MERKELRPVKAVKVRNIKDLGRIAAYLNSLGQPAYILHFRNGNKNIYGIFMIYRDYYNLYGLPIFYYCEATEEYKGNYVLVKADEAEERVEIASGIRPGWLYAPIIKLEEKPDFIDI